MGGEKERRVTTLDLREMFSEACCMRWAHRGLGAAAAVPVGS